VIETWQEQNCIATWLAERNAALGPREYAIGLKAARAPEAAGGSPALTRLYNTWEWGAVSAKAPQQALNFSPPWNWEGGRGSGDCVTMLIGNYEQHGWWRRRGCTNELVYGICERY
jgi:hypothetical protein